MQNKTTSFLVISLILIIALCIGTFSWLEKDMNEKSANTMSKVGEIYMSGMSEQTGTQKYVLCFQTTQEPDRQELMPFMSGLEAAAAIRGMNAHTSKPIDIDKVSGLLKTYIKQG